MTSRPHVQHPPAACAHGGMCMDDRPGHAVTLMRLRLAHLAADDWRDAVVVANDDDGSVELTDWLDGSSIRVWHHVRRDDLLRPGTPVVVHTRHGVLAIGDDRLSVAIA